mgnify:CR=1 FL=1
MAEIREKKEKEEEIQKTNEMIASWSEHFEVTQAKKMEEAAATAAEIINENMEKMDNEDI